MSRARHTRDVRSALRDKDEHHERDCKQNEHDKPCMGGSWGSRGRRAAGIHDHGRFGALWWRRGLGDRFRRRVFDHGGEQRGSIHRLSRRALVFRGVVRGVVRGDERAQRSRRGGHEAPVAEQSQLGVLRVQFSNRGDLEDVGGIQAGAASGAADGPWISVAP